MCSTLVSVSNSTITFKALGSGRPPYLASLVHNYSPSRTMCSSFAKLLTVPRHNLSLGSHAFRISAPTTWNSLPQNICDCLSLASFQNHLKTHCFTSAFSAVWHLIHMLLHSNLTTAICKSCTYLLTYLKHHFTVLATWILAGVCSRNYPRMKIRLGPVASSTTSRSYRPEMLASDWARVWKWENFASAPVSSCCSRHRPTSGSASVTGRTWNTVKR